MSKYGRIIKINTIKNIVRAIGDLYNSVKGDRKRHSGKSRPTKGGKLEKRNRERAIVLNPLAEKVEGQQSYQKCGKSGAGFNEPKEVRSHKRTNETWT